MNDAPPRTPGPATTAKKARPRPSPPRIPGLIDSHCHLDYSPMAEDVGAALERAVAAGVEAVVQIGCSVDRMDRAVQLAREHARVHAVVGIHPHDAKVVDDEVLERVRALAADPEVVAIGETGLDYYYDNSPKEAQKRAFAHHVALARELDMPLVLHIRDAHEDAWAVLEREPPRENPGIVHCFTGTPKESERWLELGWHISFSGIATFKRAEGLREAAKECPSDRILLETDAPFLAPEPLRGRKNEPANVAFTCQRLAEVRGESAEHLARTAADNTRRLLGLPGAPEPS